MCPMPLQRWQTMLVALLVEAPKDMAFFRGWDCIEDKLLTLEACVEAGGVTGFLATEVLGLLMSEHCC